jgi:hypothetical protein
MGDASGVFASIVLIGESLMALAKRVPMCQIGNRHNHVAAEGQLSGFFLQGGVESCIEGPLDWGKKVLLDVSKSLERNGHELEGKELVHLHK